MAMGEQNQIPVRGGVDEHAQHRNATHDGAPGKADDRVDDARVDEQQRHVGVFGVIDARGVVGLSTMLMTPVLLPRRALLTHVMVFGLPLRGPRS